MTEEEKDALRWGSHIPALAACLASTSGNVIELGVGHSSTPFLHAYCTNSDRRLYSFEDRKEWADKFQNVKHVWSYCDALSSAVSAFEWAVCFIDSGDGASSRSKLFALALPRCHYVLVHDYHQGIEESIAPLLSGVNHYIYNKYDPPTLIASMRRHPSELFK